MSQWSCSMHLPHPCRSEVVTPWGPCLWLSWMMIYGYILSLRHNNVDRYRTTHSRWSKCCSEHVDWRCRSSSNRRSLGPVTLESKCFRELMWCRQCPVYGRCEVHPSQPTLPEEQKRIVPVVWKSFVAQRSSKACHIPYCSRGSWWKTEERAW